MLVSIWIGSLSEERRVFMRNELSNIAKSGKLSWQGRIVSAQPGIRLIRSFDQRNHACPGYALRVRGVIDDDEREFLVGIGRRTQAKHQFRVGDVVYGC